MKTPFLLSLGVIAIAIIGTSCDRSVKSARGFRLPPGNAERGQTAFLDLKCNTCHTVSGVNLPPPTASPEKTMMLGGEVSRLRTYGELVTSIIHPQERISTLMSREARKVVSESPMKQVNDEMTVAQLIDLVTFLAPRYTQIAPDYIYETMP